MWIAVAGEEQKLQSTSIWVREQFSTMPSVNIKKFLLSIPMPLDFNNYAYRIHKLLQTHSEESLEVCEVLDDLQTHFPIPPTEIVAPDIWGTPTAKLRINTHLTYNFSEALKNIKNTGRELDVADERWLRLILSHWCGWSATKSSHMRDPWVKYLQALFRHLQGLVPILDSLVWPEELKHYPPGRSPPAPSLFLLATPQSYYVFQLDGLGLCRAGESLEEVYIGLKEGKYIGNDEDDWPGEEWCHVDEDERYYFPIYEHKRNSDGTFDLRHPLKEFPPNYDFVSGTDKSREKLSL